MIRFSTKLKATSSLIDLTPLVDVIFLMLIFFLITSDILPLKSLSIENPSLPKEAIPMTTQLLVVMDAQNVIYVGSKKNIVALAQLKSALQHEIDRLYERQEAVQPAIVLSIDRQVEYGIFLHLFSIAQETGLPIRLVFHPFIPNEGGSC